MRAELNIDWSELRKTRTTLDKLPNRFVASVLARTTAKLIQKAPATTGQLARSGRHRMTGKAQGEVIFDSNYSSFVHDGRASGGVDFYAIQDWAKSKGIDKRGAFAIAKSIQRKGTKKQRWIQRFIASNAMKTLLNATLKEDERHVA